MLGLFEKDSPLPALGMTSLVLGVIALALAFLPILGIPLSLCGLVCGVLGLGTHFLIPDSSSLRWVVGGIAACGLALSINLALAYAPGSNIRDRTVSRPAQPLRERDFVPPPSNPASFGD